MHARIHFINFFRKLTVTSLLFLMPLHFLKIGLSGLQIGSIYLQTLRSWRCLC